MKKLVLMIFAVTALAGCQDRVIWNDNGELKSATENREVWDTNGQMNGGERKIWVNKEGEDVVK
ncbi:MULTISPECIES: membrane lipoprotein lipid attachment site-containing protein [Marinobacter]|uniref:membrane lipoprotein lipid attachment site-containing protein n=2 Tax=Marinobacteraceae TaxID=2887365 RepID=UPI001FFE5831|nr:MULTISPECIES: membrane lipoprotein lipid attachment site-containing protein [Marinobacter]MCK2149693.1 membrane lipoprotein lipid attachment site-containing protein [Marinobacter alexandrii]